MITATKGAQSTVCKAAKVGSKTMMMMITVYFYLWFIFSLIHGLGKILKRIEYTALHS